MADVFISYAEEDRGQAEALATKIGALGYTVWWDRNLIGGSRYRQAILEQLRLACAVLVIWSPHSVQSNFVEDEAEEAREKEKFVPLRTGDLDLRRIPLGFRGYHTRLVDDVAGVEEAIKALGVKAKAVASPTSPVRNAKETCVDAPQREPRPTEIRLANCVSRYVQAILADGDIVRTLGGRPPTLQLLHSPSKAVTIRIHEWVKGEHKEVEKIGSDYLKRCMRDLYKDYTSNVAVQKDEYHGVLPLVNPNPKTNAAVTTLREVMENLHVGFEPVAKPVAVVVHFVSTSATHFLIGEAKFAEGEYDAAISAYSKAIDLDPANANAYYKRGRAYHKKKLHDHAITDYSKAIELNPKHGDAYYYRGTAHPHEDPERAIADFTRVIELDPKDLAAYFRRGDLYHYWAMADWGIADFTKVIELDPTDTVAYKQRGEIYSEKGQHEQADRDFAKAEEFESK